MAEPATPFGEYDPAEEEVEEPGPALLRADDGYVLTERGRALLEEEKMQTDLAETTAVGFETALQVLRFHARHPLTMEQITDLVRIPPDMDVMNVLRVSGTVEFINQHGSGYYIYLGE